MKAILLKILEKICGILRNNENDELFAIQNSRPIISEFAVMVEKCFQMTIDVYVIFNKANLKLRIMRNKLLGLKCRPPP
jgi:hypothetical protein